MSERVLAFFDLDDRAERAGKVATFQGLLLLAVALHELRFDHLVGAAVLLSCALLALLPAARRPVLLFAFVWLAVRHLPSFPEISNHLYVELLLLALAGGLDGGKEEEQALFLQACRWLTVLIFFWAGFQKLWYGYWLDGRLLAMLAGLDPDAYAALSWLLPAEEMARLTGYRQAAVPGPFLVDSGFFLLLSNLAWLSELLVAALLLVPRTRTLGALAGLATMLGIQLIARELVFGVLMAALLCLFAPRDWNRRLLPAYALLMLGMVGTRLGWLPELRWN